MGRSNNQVIFGNAVKIILTKIISVTVNFWETFTFNYAVQNLMQMGIKQAVINLFNDKNPFLRTFQGTSVLRNIFWEMLMYLD